MTPPRKQLLHLSPLAEIGGCEVNCLRIVKACGDYDHRVLIFDVPGPISGELEKAGASVEHLGAWRLGLGKFTQALHAWAARQGRPDGILCWSTSRLTTLRRTLGLWETPWVVHAGNPLRGGFATAIRRLGAEWSLATSPRTALAACSHHVAESYRSAFFFRRFPARVVYNAVDPSFDQEHRYRPLPAGTAPRVGMVARLDRIKDHATIIRALAALASTRSDIVVEFAGDGPLRPALELEARRLGVADRVRFLGFQRVQDLLPQWDAYLHSTTDREGMGTAVAEAMMSGLPCLVTDLAVMREVCGPEGAVYAPAGDAEATARALVGLIDDRKRREALGFQARERARRMFAMDSMVKGYTGLLFADTGGAVP